MLLKFIQSEFWLFKIVLKKWYFLNRENIIFKLLIIKIFLIYTLFLILKYNLERQPSDILKYKVTCHFNDKFFSGMIY